MVGEDVVGGVLFGYLGRRLCCFFRGLSYICIVYPYFIYALYTIRSFIVYPIGFMNGKFHVYFAELLFIKRTIELFYYSIVLMYF